MAAAALAAALFMTAPGLPAGGAAGHGAAVAAEVDWSARLIFSERYDDNITQLSQKDLDRLDTQGGGDGEPCGSSSTATGGGRFSIETPDDYVSIPELRTSLSAGWLAGRPTVFDLDVAAYEFARNSIKSWQSYRLSVEQPLHRGMHATTVGVSYGLVPRYYLRNLRSDRAFEELGVLPAPRREVTYRRHSADLEIGQVVVPGHLRFSGVAGREGRDYNRCFDERDSEMSFQSFELAWQPLGDQKLRLRVSYRHEDLHAGGDLPEIALLTEEDISSRRAIWAGDLRVRWGKRGRRKTISLRHEVELRDYSTTNPNDRFHFERTDHRRFTTIAARVELKRGWFLTAAGERDTNQADFPTTLGPPPEETTDYTENLLQAGFGYDFGVAARRGRGRPPGAPED